MTRFVQVDAFAERPFTGNPAAVLPLEAWPDDATLQRIAEENNLAETAFFVPDASGTADYELRWFTPAVEIALCGHATLASGHVVLGDDPVRERVTFRTRKSGVLEVARTGDDYELSLPAHPPTPRPLPQAVAGLGVATAVETLWHQNHYALVVLADEAAVRALAPDFRALARLTADEAPDAVPDVLTIVTAPGDATDVVSRVFAPAHGIDEDPVTGAAHTVLTPYWAARLGRASFTAFQASRRGGRVACRLEGNRVVLGGGCVTVIEGDFYL